MTVATLILVAILAVYEAAGILGARSRKARERFADQVATNLIDEKGLDGLIADELERRLRTRSRLG